MERSLREEGKEEDRGEGRTGDPRILLQPRQDQVQDPTTDVLEHSVDVADLAEVGLEGRALVVEHDVLVLGEELVLEPLALVGAAGDGDDPAAVDLGELTSLRAEERASEADFEEVERDEKEGGTHDRADGACSARDDDRLAGLDLGDVVKAPVSRLRGSAGQRTGERGGRAVWEGRRTWPVMPRAPRYSVGEMVESTLRVRWCESALEEA